MSEDVYEWIEPWEARAQAFNRGHRQGRAEGFSQGALETLKRAAEPAMREAISYTASRVGMALANAPEFQEAVAQVADAVIREGHELDIERLMAAPDTAVITQRIMIMRPLQLGCRVEVQMPRWR